VEGQRDGDVGTLEQPLTLGKETLDQPCEAWSCGVKGRADGIGSYLLQLASND